MDQIPFLDGHGQLTFRWIHFVAGVLWIGLLYFFNWVNGPFAATMDGETKKKVVPELMPRALYFFRWGAAWTWLTGVVLLFLLYYFGKVEGPIYFATDSAHSGTNPEPGQWIIPLAGVLIGFPIYDILFKTLGAKQHTAAVAIWGAIVVLFAWLLSGPLELSGRATIIHTAGLLGTAMAANVWMRIWPAQRRIITAVKGGQAPNPADPAVAGLRSRHNTYMSVPLLLFMVSVNQVAMIGAPRPWLWIAVTMLVAFAATYGIYKVAAKVKGF